MTTAHEHWYGVNWPLLSLLCIQYGDKRASRRHYTRVPPSPPVPLVMALQSNKWNGGIESVCVLVKNNSMSCSIGDWKRKRCSSSFVLSVLYWSIFVNQAQRICFSLNITQDELTSLVKQNKRRRWRSDDVSIEATNSLFKENGKAIEIGIGKLIFLSSHFFFNDYLNKC